MEEKFTVVEDAPKEIELYSEEVHDIMSEMPYWVLRKGITLLSVIVLIILIGSWFFKYPDIVRGEVIVTFIQPPAAIIAQSTGKIDTIFIHNNDYIKKQQPLAAIQNTSNTMDMLTLIHNLEAWEKAEHNLDDAFILFPTQKFNLGTIQTAYTSFLNTLNDYATYKKLNYYQQKIASQKKQLETQQEYFESVVRQLPVMSEMYKTSKIIFERDSILFSKKVISENEYDVSKNYFLQQKRTYLSQKASLKQSELQILQSEGDLLDLKKQAVEMQNKHLLYLQNATDELKAQIKAWKRDYLLESPIDGRVKQMGIWSNNQNVNLGGTIFTVSPTCNNKPTGKAYISVQGAGKMKVGQRVNVRLNNFPDQEFGYLIGYISSLSTIPNTDGFYIVDINFPDGMKTNYGKILPFTQQMVGNADVITDDIRFIERVLMPIKRIFKNQM